jgi:hypothetical protein
MDVPPSKKLLTESEDFSHARGAHGAIDGLSPGNAVEYWLCNHASGNVIEGARGAIASSRTGDPGIGEFEYAPNRPQTQSGSMSQMGQTEKSE